MTTVALARIALCSLETLEPLAQPEAVATVHQWLAIDAQRALAASSLCDELFSAAGEGRGNSDAARLAVLALRRAIHNARLIEHSQLDAARPRLTPPLYERLQQHRVLQDQVVLARRNADVAARRAILASRYALAAALADSAFLEALQLVSRPLALDVTRLAQRDAQSWTRDQRYTAAKAARYLFRMATKTSPYGLFCATALAHCNGDQQRQARPVGTPHASLLLSIAEVRKITACLAIDPEAEAAIAPRLNPTARKLDGHWVFWRPATYRRDEDDEFLSRVPASAAVELAVRTLNARRVTRPEWIDALTTALGATRHDAERFAQKLIDSAFVLAEIEIPYNEPRPLQALASRCYVAGASPAWLPVLDGIENDVDQWPAASAQERDELRHRIASQLESLPHARPLQPDETLRVDATCNPDLTIPAAWVESVATAMSVYARTFAALYPEAAYRAHYVQRFLELHPADVDIPLIDLYHGAFEPGGPVARPLAFADPADSAAATSQAAQCFHQLRERLVERALSAPTESIELAPLLHEICGDTPEPRWTAGVAFQAAQLADMSDEESPPHLVVSAIFHGAGLAFARFARLYAHDGEGTTGPLADELRRAWRSLEKPGAILAELTYNHTARTANAGLRPALLPYEIELPGETASPRATAIPLIALTVRFDSATQQFVLRWPERGVNVIPIINSGVNPSGVISFLINIGQQGLQPLGLMPGFDDPGVTRWPRLVCGKTVLMRERWVLRNGDWPQPTSGDAAFLLDTLAWQARHQLPRHLFVATSADPKPQYLDLAAPCAVELLARSVSKLHDTTAPMMIVTEMFPAPGQLWVQGLHGHLASEFLIQLQHRPEQEPHS